MRHVFLATVSKIHLQGQVYLGLFVYPLSTKIESVSESLHNCLVI